MIKNLVLVGFLLVGIMLVYRLGAIPQTKTSVLGVTTSKSSSSVLALTDGQVTWCIDPIYGSKKCFDSISYTAGETVYDTFVALADREGDIFYEAKKSEDQGISINTINGATMHSNDTTSIAWRFTINGAASNQGLDNISARDHDHYELNYRLN